MLHAFTNTDIQCPTVTNVLQLETIAIVLETIPFSTCYTVTQLHFIKEIIKILNKMYPCNRVTLWITAITP